MTFEEWLQSRLTAHGFAVGPIDGVIGDKTQAALRAFKTAHGLPADTFTDENTVIVLRKSASVLPAGTSVPNRAVDIPEPKFVLPDIWPRQPDVPKFYGGVGTSQTQIDVPFDMFLAWAKGTRVRRMTLHTKVAASAARVLERIAQTYSIAERSMLGIDMFGGSLNVRRMRGGTSYSMHSWGIAIDFDPERNQLSWHAPKARLSHADAMPFWKAWEDEGWLSLGRARDFDWMHVQAARL